VNLWSLALGAHLAWKPLLVLNAAFLVYVVVRTRAGGSVAAERARLGSAFIVATLLLTALLYLPSLGANFVRFDWTHRVTTEPVTSAAHLGYFFVTPQPDRFYRPLTLISLWADNRLFGSWLWPYHLQNIALHAVNAMLAGLLAAGLGFSRWSSRFTALLFGMGAVRFEAVVWPGARFDVLATTFSLIALLCFLRFWRAERAVVAWGAAVVFAYVAAVLSKESGYSLLLILPLLAATWLRPIRTKRGLGLLAALALCTCALMAIRYRMYGGVGGYTGQFGFDFRTIYLFLRNALAASIFGLNAIPHSAWPLLITVAFAIVLVATGMAYRGADRRRVLTLMALTLVSAIPVVNLIGWLNAGLENSRYLYWPSLWMCMLLALVFEASRRRMALACALLALQAMGVLWNEGVYSDLSSKAGLIAIQVRRDAARQSVSTVQFRGTAGSTDGVFAFGAELEAKTRAALPGVTVETCSALCSGGDGTVIYRWDEASRTMQRVWWHFSAGRFWPDAPRLPSLGALPSTLVVVCD